MSANANYQKIWHTVCLIPKGKVASYGQIADLAGLPGRARLVGKAMSLIPGNLHLPWYRVLRSTGQLAFGPATPQAAEQTGLLQQENVPVLNNRVSIKSFGWQPSLEQMLWQLEG